MSKNTKDSVEADTQEHEGEIEALAENDIGAIYPCDCGGANLTMGPMTLHLAAHEVKGLHELLSHALGGEAETAELEARDDAEQDAPKKPDFLH